MTTPTLIRAAEQDTTLAFGQSVAADLELMRFLREATSHAVRLRWTLAGVPLLPLSTHVHLLRPVAGVDAASSAYAMRWAAGYRYGTFFYRQGPGFVVVKDVRPDLPPSRMVIDSGAEHFVAMAAARTVGDLPPEAVDVLADAEEAGLVLRHDGHILVLPYRMRHWPVPYIAA
jgi:hypothetical protein